MGSENLTDYYRERFLKKIEELARIHRWPDSQVNELLAHINQILDSLHTVCITYMIEDGNAEEAHMLWHCEAETLRRWLSFIFENQIVLEEEQ